MRAIIDGVPDSLRGYAAGMPDGFWTVVLIMLLPMWPILLWAAFEALR